MERAANSRGHDPHTARLAAPTSTSLRVGRESRGRRRVPTVDVCSVQDHTVPVTVPVAWDRRAFCQAAGCALLLVSFVAERCAADQHLVRPGADPQAVLDTARPGERIVFLPGLHQHRLNRHRSILYVDKPVDIELRRGATLKLADHETPLQGFPEITIDHGAPKDINDLEVGGDFDLSAGPVVFTIMIDEQGNNDQPDTFGWGAGPLFEYRRTQVAITGNWQQLAHGVEIRFGSRSGHNRGSLWFVSYDGPESYGIRIGHGLQRDYIDTVRVLGKGTIDMNASHNVVPSGLSRNINACVLVHGRVRHVSIEDITMTDTMRSVMVYGEHSGRFRQGGGTTPGESFDAEDISIQYTRTLNPDGSGYLLGHPSHRGRLKRVRCNHNYMVTATTAIEPNFQLDQYEVVGNVIKSDGHAIHCWRKSTNGYIADNLRIDDIANREVVVLGAPGAWERPKGISLKNNRNHLGDRTEAPPAWSGARPGSAETDSPTGSP